jgi:ribosomal protein S12 methylthiotransferase accessory factor
VIAVAVVAAAVVAAAVAHVLAETWMSLKGAPPLATPLKLTQASGSRVTRYQKAPAKTAKAALVNAEQSHVFGKLRRLLQPHSPGGLFTSARLHYSGPEVSPEIILSASQLGNLAAVWPNSEWYGNCIVQRASGSGLTAEDAMVPALVEGLERYSTGVCRDEQFIFASAAELGAKSLNLDEVPRCSDRELAHPKCPLILPDKQKPIRYVQGLSLLDGRPVYVPAVMAYSYVVNIQPAERFWLPISTGCGGHSSYGDALLSGIYEVIERDAISIVWLQKLPLSRIEVDVQPPLLAPLWESFLSGSSHVQTSFFDATLDLGVPTVYAVQRSLMNQHAATLLACSSSHSIVNALAKTIRDLAMMNAAFRQTRPVPESWDDFSEPMHGAAYMGHFDRRHAFDFLLKSPRTTKLSVLMRSDPQDRSLRHLLNVLRKKELSAYAVDLSTDEAVRSGIRIVRVIIPGLQPLSFRYRARFLGHSRLYQLPRQMGFPVLAEGELNNFPQPFA